MSQDTTPAQESQVTIFTSMPPQRPVHPGKPQEEETPTPGAEETTTTETVAETQPEPTMGWPAFWWRIKRTFDKDATPPKLSRKEQEFRQAEHEKIEREARAAAEEIKRQMKLKAEEDRKVRVRTESVNKLCDFSDEVPSLTVVFIGVKGASGTTTTTAHTASVFGDITRKVVVATDLNPAQGTLAARLGKDYDETTTLRELRGDLPGFTNFHTFIRKIGATRYSVRPISANDIVGDNEHLSGEDAQRILDTIHANTEFHHVDTANDITDEVTLAAVREADVIVFTAFVQIHDSLRQLAVGMQTLRKHGFGDKVDNSIVVISGLKPDENLENYRKFTNRVNIHDEIVSKYKFDGPFIGIPYDDVIRRDTQVDLGALNWETYQAYLDLNLLIFEQALNSQAQPVAAS